MINANNVKTQSCFGMPASARVRTPWLGALPISTGEVSALAMAAKGTDVMGTGVQQHRVAADNCTFPGTSVWSPPT